MAIQVGGVSPGVVRWPIQVGGVSPGEVRWPYRLVRCLQVR